MRRGVVEHGKTCYIEGYKKHAELFYTFLVKNGYFNDEELNRIIAEFETYLKGTPCVSIPHAEDVFTKMYPWLPKDSCLNSDQKDIITKYVDDGNKPILKIVKPRQHGATTILKIIAYIEAKYNGKKVLYCGYGPLDKMFQDAQTLSYWEIPPSVTKAPDRYTHSKRYDLVIIDEVSGFVHPIDVVKDFFPCTDKLVIVGTPTTSSNKNYEELRKCMLFSLHEDCSDDGSTLCKISPNEHDIKRSALYPNCKNEILGIFNDNY